MKNRLLGTRILVVLIVFLTLAAFLKLRPLLIDFDTTKIRIALQERPDSAGRRMDEVMLRNLRHLGYIRSFDHQFQQDNVRIRIERPLWVDRCEVRQGEFYKFSNWRNFHRELPIAAPGQPPDWQHFSNNRNHVVSGRLDAPANGLTWYDAYAYCQAVDGRLPTAGEWIAAAAGSEEQLYPWGDAFRSDAWPYLDPLLNAAQKCGLHPATHTPEGLADMGQNVSEWAVADGDSKQAVVMGGNAYNLPRELYSLAALYRQAPSDFRSAYLGFRCVYEYPPQRSPWRTVLDAVAIAPGDYPAGVPEDALVPGLVAQLPPERLELVEQLFVHRDASTPADLYITVREITRREYHVFLQDLFVIAGLYAEENQPAGHSYRPPDWELQMQSPDLPVVNLDWWSAYAFASWAGGRLPSAEEWAFVASAGGKHIYPWGDQFNDAAAVSGELRSGGPRVPVGPVADQTPTGVLDMGGNVSEWTRSVSGVSGAYAVIIKGGNYLLPGDETARMDFSNHASPHYRSPTLGFRVVFDGPR